MARHGKMLMLMALAVSLLALTLTSAEQCGSQADNQKCPNNLCCSKYGYCGSTDEYCGNGCQSQCHGRGHGAYGALAADEQCGHQADNQKCPNNLCCSKYGYCGSTDEYCGQGCQSQCHGRGHGAYGALAADEQCGHQADNQKCPNNLCCSKYGYCGSTNEYCGEGCQSQCSDHVGLRSSTGKASYYTRYVPSACYGNDESQLPRNRHMAAVSDGHPNLWKNGEGCGKHYRVRCEGNGCRNADAITIKVVDRCPNGCEGRVFDLSEEAFGAIADKNAGVIKVQYEPVNSDDVGLRASTGKASHYNRYVPSACYGNDESQLPRNRHMAAVSDGHPNLWKNGEGCGKYYRVRCEGNGCRNGDAITIKVVDRCPNGCEGRVFDLSEEAFGAIADKNAGVIKVQYEPVNSDDAIPWAQKKLIAEVGRIRK